MTGIRRALVLIGLTVAVMVGAAIPASATFADSVTATADVTTATVDAPDWAHAAVTYCHPVQTAEATGNWPGSTARDVTGYRLTTYLNDGRSIVLTQTGTAARSYTMRFSRSDLQFQPRIAVTTLTSYGWTSESPRSGVLAC